MASKHQKTLIGFGGHRFAVHDVGTNTVKFHVGERSADGAWRRVDDRAEETRLGMLVGVAVGLELAHELMRSQGDES